MNFEWAPAENQDTTAIIFFNILVPISKVISFANNIAHLIHFWLTYGHWTLAFIQTDTIKEMKPIRPQTSDWNNLFSRNESVDFILSDKKKSSEIDK